jgi:DNA repair protein RecO (recombination protein O)
MEWTDEAIVLTARRHGEGAAIVTLLTRERGRHAGLVPGGAGKRARGLYEAGNKVIVTWRARLEEHLGVFTLELLEAHAAGLIADRTRLYASQLLCDHLRLLPERDPHDRLLGMTMAALAPGQTPLALGAALARFELVLLDELGFGLDLSSCAVTGVTTGLTHVSPKSGRAVSLEAAAPYLGRLLELPAFLTAGGPATPADLAAAFALTGHFLDLHIWSPRQLAPPPTRDPLIHILCAPPAAT